MITIIMVRFSLDCRTGCDLRDIAGGIAIFIRPILLTLPLPLTGCDLIHLAKVASNWRDGL